MTLTQAKVIQGMMTQWAMYHMGVVHNKPDPIRGITLLQMLKANEILERRNNKKRNDGKGRTVMLTIDDRLIAAIYVAMNYETDIRATSVSSIACHGSNFVYVVNESHCLK